MPSVPRLRALTLCLALALACGPEPANSTGTGSSSSPTGSVTTTTPTTTATTTATTGAVPACGGVALPQMLPAGTQTTYWRPLTDVNDPIDAAQVFFVVATDDCTQDPSVPCPGEGSPARIAYYVALAPAQRQPGVYPVAAGLESDGVYIGAIITNTGTDHCTIAYTTAADDGEVEVLAADDECIAIDIRGVTPTAHAGITVNPNGSGHAPLCAL